MLKERWGVPGPVEIMRALSTQRRAGHRDSAGRESQREIDKDLRLREREASQSVVILAPDIPQIASAS